MKNTSSRQSTKCSLSTAFARMTAALAKPLAGGLIATSLLLAASGLALAGGGNNMGSQLQVLPRTTPRSWAATDWVISLTGSPP